MNFSSDSLLDFSQSLIDINEKLKKCPICNNITDRDICYICSDERHSCAQLRTGAYKRAEYRR